MQYRTFRLVLLAASWVSVIHSAAGLSLLDRSPFVWPGFQANQPPAQPQKPATAPSDLEFHAVYELSGMTRVLVKDRRKNEFHWLALGEESDGMLPKQYNRDKDELLLAYDNQEKWLSLQALPQASGTPVAVAQPSPASGASANTSIAPRRRVIRPSTSTSSSSRNVIRPASLTSQTVPLRQPARRPVSAAQLPGVTQPSFTPADPGPPPNSSPPEENPGLAPPQIHARGP